MTSEASELAHRLAEQAEAVCRQYLSNGRRVGSYWSVGDVRNASGRSMFVRLTGPEGGNGAAGKWTDAATGEHGDLLDVIRETCGLLKFSDVAREARSFLDLSQQQQPLANRSLRLERVPTGSPEAARRLLEISRPITGTVAETYLQHRHILDLGNTGALRFHPRCHYRTMAGTAEDWPAMITAVTDRDGNVTGALRTWLARDGADKAPLDTPRRAMGSLHGNAVRFGTTGEVMAAGEGIETMLSLRQILPDLPILAALSAAHLAVLLLPPTLRRLYIARDNDDAGDRAATRLAERARRAGIDAIVLSPVLGDFNDDLRLLGVDALRASIRVQLAPQDVPRFLISPA